MLTSFADAGQGSSPKDSAAVSLKKENWDQKIKRYKDDADEIKKQAEKYEKDADKMREESHRAHDRADRYDVGELGVELALVLCSLAVLTKRPRFWHVGIGVGVLGACVAASALLLR